MFTDDADSAPTPRSELLQIPADVHGALDYAELANQRLTAEEVIDFSENSNPFGPAPAVRAALATADPARYPDRECLALRWVLAEQLGALPDAVVVGNGAAELLWLIVFAFLRSGDRVLILGPTFGEYARMAQLMGAQVVPWRAHTETNFAVDEEAVTATLAAVQPRLVFCCNPNNPTGTVIPIATIGMWAAAQPRALFVIDEAYLAFVPGLASVYSLGLPNVVVVRSLTKEYALAGLRLGYALGPLPLLEGLRRARVPWSVNSLAQVAGVAALQDQEHLQRSLAALQQATADLRAGLAMLGLHPLPSATHYMLLKVGDGAAFRQELLQHGLVVRDCASFGLPAYVRLATRKPVENQQLLTYLQKL